MIQIRQNIFETNSSSIHTLTVTDNDTYEKWINGELLYIDEDESWCLKNIDFNSEIENFVSKERAIDLYEQIVENEYHPSFEEIFKTYSQWYNSLDELSNYKANYTTKKGEKIVIFGKHGYYG